MQNSQTVVDKLRLYNGVWHGDGMEGHGVRTCRFG